ncbi:hypothetical protein STEG23_033102 [Scotinomys teguina]
MYDFLLWGPPEQQEEVPGLVDPVFPPRPPAYKTVPPTLGQGLLLFIFSGNAPIERRVRFSYLIGTLKDFAESQDLQELFCTVGYTGKASLKIDDRGMMSCPDDTKIKHLQGKKATLSGDLGNIWLGRSLELLQISSHLIDPTGSGL